MPISYYAARANLYYLWQQHPTWSHAELAAALACSTSWVEKWLKRFGEELAAGQRLDQVLLGHSRARKTPAATTHPLVVEQILSIRDQPPEGLRRVPGQEAIRYYLERDPFLQFFQLPVPSCKTIYRVLKSHDRIAQRSMRVQQPVERPAPMTCWQIDFKDVSSVPAEPEGKRQHVVETLNIIDTGTSVLLDAHVRSDFTAETALEALALTLVKYGRPTRITLDRDPRWVGSPAGSDFPAALVRFGACLGIEIQLCEPHHPQQNDLVAYCTPSAWLACSLIFVSVLLRSMFIGWREDRDPMIIGSIHGKQTRSPPTHDGLLAYSVGFCSFLRRQQTAFA